MSYITNNPRDSIGSNHLPVACGCARCGGIFAPFYFASLHKLRAADRRVGETQLHVPVYVTATGRCEECSFAGRQRPNWRQRQAEILAASGAFAIQRVRRAACGAGIPAPAAEVML
jgi:hypothetical protein